MVGPKYVEMKHRAGKAHQVLMVLLPWTKKGDQTCLDVAEGEQGPRSSFTSFAKEKRLIPDP